MKVRIAKHIDAPDGSYAYYPGQVIVDHEHEADWIAKGLAVEIDKPGPKEKAVMPQKNEERKRE